MAITRLEIESVKKGRALRKAFYIERVKYFGDPAKRENLKHVAHGNLPTWCNNDPMAFWRAADQYERENAAACREVLLTLPRELTLDQNVELTESWIRRELPGKPHHFALHASNGDCHAHVLFSDRAPDEYERPSERYFRRFNRAAPELGGAKKASGGQSSVALRAGFTQMKKRWEDLQNQAIAANAHRASGGRGSGDA